MKFFPIDFSSFKISITLPKNSIHQNEIHRGVFRDSDWFVKKTKDRDSALRELIANELFRLISDHPHPCTLVAKKEEEQTVDWFVLSEDFSPSYEMAEIAALENYFGFADILVTSVWIHEVDLRLPNILVNHTEKKLAKIDGGCSFYGLRHKMQDDDMTEFNILNTLPYPDRYCAYHWLTYISSNGSFELRYFPKPDHLPACFTEEKNKAILRICLLPESFISSLLEVILLKSNVNVFCEFLVNRQHQMRASVFNNSTFIEYLQSDKAKADSDIFLKKMKDFVTHDIKIIKNSPSISLLESQYAKIFEDLLSEAETKSRRKESSVLNYSIFSDPVSSNADNTSSAFDAKKLGGPLA
jgi:hypothetical protein